MNTSIMEKQQDLGLLLARLTVSILIMFHGVGNLISGYAFIKMVLAGLGIPEFLAYGVFIGEIIAPIMIIAGYRARLASIILAFNMLVAIFTAHAGDVFALNQYGGWAIELQGLYLFGSFVIFLGGAGKYALSNDSVWD